jgi:hypothetical protein
VVLEVQIRALPAIALESMLGDHEADGSRTAMVGEAVRDAVDICTRMLGLTTCACPALRCAAAVR